jgi:transcriptional regulator with PAS, ATPase and Fis domain
VLLARPAGYQKVFRTEAAARPLAADPVVTRFGDFASADVPTRRMLDDLQRLAAAEVNLLIVGETGTGKELLARHVHACSPRRGEPYLAINCGAISEHLMESTFFGYVKGAFSGADPRGRAGYFESAGGGTLFLDEVGELPPAMQAALLRVLEDGSFQRVGSCETRRARCRIIAATHRQLEQQCAEGLFRQDLYYRLKVAQCSITPLRDRPCDIPLLAERFIESLRIKHGLGEVSLTDEAQAALARYQWPGNAREMRNVIEAAILCAEGTIGLENLPPEIRQDAMPPAAPSQSPASAEGVESLASVRDYERQLIIGMLRKYRKANQVAQLLGLARSTLYRKFAELGIQPGDFTGGPADAE